MPVLKLILSPALEKLKELWERKEYGSDVATVDALCEDSNEGDTNVLQVPYKERSAL